MPIRRLWGRRDSVQVEQGEERRDLSDPLWLPRQCERLRVIMVRSAIRLLSGSQPARLLFLSMAAGLTVQEGRFPGIIRLSTTQRSFRVAVAQY